MAQQTVALKSDASTTVATALIDEVGGIAIACSKIIIGADDTNDGFVSSANPLPISVASIPSHAVTNAGTFAVQAAQSGTWNVTNVSGTISLPTGAATAAKQPALGTAGTASSDVITVQGVTSMTPLVIADGGGSITVDGTVTVTGAGSTTQYTEDGASAGGESLTLAGAVRRDTAASSSATDGDYSTLNTDATGRLWTHVGTIDGGTISTITSVVHVDDNSGSLTVDGTVAISGTVTVGSHAVTNAGTFAVQVDGTALTKLTDIETNTDSGAVVGNGAAATAQRVTLANDSTGIVALTTSTASIGKLASNSGVTIGAVEIAAAQTLATVTTCSTVTTVSTLTGGGVAHDGADSGNPIKVGARAAATLSDDTMVVNADRTDMVSDLDGALIVRSGFPLGDLISERVTNTDGTSTAFSNFGAVANTRSYITAISVYNSSATDGYIDFRDGTAGSVLFTVPIPTLSGCVVAMGGTPLFRTTANTALAYDVSGALSTVYISVSGFKSKV